ncbi:MAG: HAD family hydrolase [Chloroflexota bacterium]|nr:HAD family hydrolase [Chloroflexota bacterium]
MNVFFDVDDTLICGLDGTLRPHVADIFARIRADGHAIYVWSSAGRRWQDLERHGLHAFVSECYLKPDGDYERTLRAQNVAEPHFVVDDHRDIVDVFGGCQVRPYLEPDVGDTEMIRAYDALREFAQRRS